MKKILLMLIFLGLFSINAFCQAFQLIEMDLGAITTPGVTAVVRVDSVNQHTFQIVAAGISVNVVVRAEGSLDNSSFYNLDDDETDTTYTSDSTYLLWKAGGFISKYVRLRFVSESGGTASTLNVKYMGAN